MAVYKENYCVGCETCYHCGRDKDVWIWECDICGDTFYEEDEVIQINGKDYCERCYKAEFEPEEDEEDVSA